MRKFILSAGCLLFGGCALMDTGEIEYRRAEPPSAQFAQSISRGGSYCEPVHAGQPEQVRGEPRSYGSRYSRWACIPLFPAPLIRRNASIGDPIEPGDIYSIRIDHAVIAEMLETPVSFRRLFAGRGPFRRVGEIAVLANTFEFAPPNGGDSTDPTDFVNVSNLTGVKVVYYNPDVEQGQALNFSNIPLTEGREYNGRPVGIQIVVLELDRMSGPMQNLMRTLAALGQQSSALPSGIATQALLDLGASLISQENDDVMFEYRFVLDRSDGANRVSAAPFEAGRYVVRRTHERRRSARWDHLILDHNTGELMEPVPPLGAQQVPNPETRYVAFDQDTYFTLNVVRHEDDGAFAYDPQSFEELGREIERAAAARDAPLNSATQRLTGALVAVRNQQINNDLVEAWRIAAARYRVYARHHADRNVEGVGTSCRVTDDPDRFRMAQEALFEARTAAADFISLYENAETEARRPENSGGTGNAARPLFTDEVQRRVLASLGSFFAPFPTAVAVNQAVLTSPADFRSGFTGPKAADFLDAAQLAAELNWAPRTCDSLIAARLAVPVPPVQPAPQPGPEGTD